VVISVLLLGKSIIVTFIRRISPRGASVKAILTGAKSIQVQASSLATS
jgi:hypothetical protein